MFPEGQAPHARSAGSRTEASIAAFLERHVIEWQYEPVAFAHENRQYLPDFRVCGLTGSLPMYVDVKGPDSTPWSARNC